MVENSLSLVRFEKYFKLLKGLTGTITALGVYDLFGQNIWEGSLQQGDEIFQLQSYFKEHPSEWKHLHDEITTHRLDTRYRIHLLSLLDDNNEHTATLAVLLVDVDCNEPQQIIQINEALQSLTDCIQTEFNLHRALVKKDYELGAMADELIERYEELNLVYDTEEKYQDTYQGRESLRHLVHSCTEFLSVGMAALFLPDKAVAIYDFNPSEKNLNFSKVISGIRDGLYDWIKANNQSVVINKSLDAVSYKVHPDLPYKILACPIHGGEIDIIGMMVILNPNYKLDFSNSDRNLLDVIANKAAKIIQSNYDALTGLENSHSFEWNVQEALNQTREHGSTHAILNIDLDRFSVVNDISGRTAGDQLLKAIGRVIQKLVRSRDIVGRLSGGTFGVLLENCPLKTATMLAKNIGREISAKNFEWEDQIHEISASIGVAPITAECDSVASIFSSVEVAINSAKERGRNRLQVFEMDDTDLLRRKEEMLWVSRLQQALRDNRFELYAQLIQPLQNNNSPSHYEILLRMINEDGKVIPPGAFMPAAEHYHLMPEIDRWVIKSAFAQLLDSTQMKLCHPCRLALNLSGQSLSDETFRQYVCDQLNTLGQYTKFICFEVTESAAIANLQEAQRFISMVKELGCEFSLDDFGTGLSSFAYLQNLSVDYLKIDGTFVCKIETDKVSRTMVSAINQVGHAMGLRTIAEFVENDSIAKYLTQLGVDYGQGYGLGMPQPFRNCLHDLASNHKAAS